MYSLEKKRAVITGAASGLGRSLATTLAGEGWRIGIVDINDSRSLETLDMVERAGGSGEVFHADVSVPGNVKDFADHFFGTWSGVDLLVNDAGVAVCGFVGDIPLEDWEWIFATNFWGMLYGCHEFIPRMKVQGGGHILNVASAAGLLSCVEQAPYNATKAAVISLSETLRVEVAPYDIDISVACPMFFKTNLGETARFGTEEERENTELLMDCGRTTCDEVAQRVLAAVKKNRLYAVPMFSGKANWSQLRLSPEMYYAIFRLLNRHGMFWPFIRRVARWGMM